MISRVPGGHWGFSNSANLRGYSSSAFNKPR
jgi:hypothetical protein